MNTYLRYEIFRNFPHNYFALNSNFLVIFRFEHLQFSFYSYCHCDFRHTRTQHVPILTIYAFSGLYTTGPWRMQIYLNRLLKQYVRHVR
jgi:hypothetical protein